jgi:hypothetical protein
MVAGNIGLGAQAGGYDIRADVLSGIQQASASTGVDFGFLMAQAAKESGFNPDAKAKTSSASGLYQFVEQTWLSVVRKHGADHGLGDLADKIKIADDGSLKVADRATRKEILDLRRDPTIAAAMAAEHAADNEERLDAKLDRDVQPVDLYLAHFLGLQGAVNFLRAMDADPDQAAAEVSPRAAAANQAVFYNADGTPRSLKQIYDRFQDRMTTDIAAYDDLDDSQPAYAGTMLADARHAGSLGGGDRAVYGSTNSGGILSPLMLVTLASLPTGRESDDKDKDGQSSGSLFDRAAPFNPAA